MSWSRALIPGVGVLETDSVPSVFKCLAHRYQQKGMLNVSRERKLHASFFNVFII